MIERFGRTLCSLLAGFLLLIAVALGLNVSVYAVVTGSGTEAEPYVIRSSSDFSKMNKSDAYFILEEDIILSNWTPFDFSGVLDGKGHTITHRYNKTTKVSSIALFSNNSGTIRNTTFDCNVTYTFYETDSSGKMAGICIVNNGTIENCVVTGSFDTTVFDTHYNSADTAGICIENKGIIQGCEVYADIRSNCNSVYCSDEIAGICISNGKNGLVTRSVVKNYMNADDNAAGLVRINYGKITECCTASDISYNSVAFANNYAETTGGAIGSVENCISFSVLSKGTAVTKGCKNCISAGTIYYSGTSIAEEAVNSYHIGGQGLVNSCYGLYMEESFSAADFPGFDFQKTWYITDYGVPYLRNLNLAAPESVTISGTEELRVGGEQLMKLEISPQNAVLYSLDYEFSEGDHTARWSGYGSEMRFYITPVSTGQTRLVFRDAVAGVMGFKNYTIIQGVESIAVSGPTRIGLGQTVQLTGTVSPSNATNKNFHFEAPQGTYPIRLNVTPDGKVTGLVLGDAWLFAVSEDGNIRSRYELEVVKMPLSVTLSKSVVTLYPDDAILLEAEISPTDVEDGSYTWESDNAAVATVESNGRVRAKGYGTTVIRAVCNDGGAFGECTVTVVKKPESITLAGPETLGFGEETEYRINVVPEDAVINGQVFLEYDEAVLSVKHQNANTIKVTAIGGGKTTLRAFLGNSDLMAQCSLEVIRRPDSIHIQEEELFMETGQQYKLTATVLPEDTTNKEIIWTSDNETIATVSGSGVITAKRVGTATISCKTLDGDKSNSVFVRVQIPADSMELESTDVSIFVDQVYKIKATITPENATYQTLLLESVGNLLEIDQENQSICGKLPGEAILKVSTLDRKLKETIFVTILPANHEYGEFVFVWTEDYSGCTMTRQCRKDCPSIQTVECSVSKEILSATCSAEGYTIYNAEVNFEGTHYWDEKREIIPALLHDHKPVVTEPTCTENGFTTYICNCGDSYITDQVEAIGHRLDQWDITEDATCIEEGSKTATCKRENCDYRETKRIPATGDHTYTDKEDIACDVCGYQRQEVEEENSSDEEGLGIIPVYRLYNPYTHEHLLTGGAAEKDLLISIGWSLDGVAWEAPVDGISVYRLYNPYDDWHTYTTSEVERDAMVAAGWTVDGVVSRGYTGENGRPIYRLFNPYVQTNFHLFTAGVDERDLLVSAGWILEGVAWGAVK